MVSRRIIRAGRKGRSWKRKSKWSRI